MDEPMWKSPTPTFSKEDATSVGTGPTAEKEKVQAQA
jgi:hypothetical protein